MVDANWNDERKQMTPINLYMEYILLGYNNFLKEKIIDVNITYGELTYIYNIGYVDSVSQKELADILYVSQANVTKMVKKLEKKGFITRQTDENNKSKKVLSLTSNGKEILLKINEITLEWEKIVTEKINNENIANFKEILYLLSEESTELL